MHTTSKRLIATAAAAVLATVSVSTAQYQVDRSRANDANQRAGSGGYNQADTRAKPWDVQNNIVYGNITGGKEFRGQASGDPFEFRGQTAGVASDRFVRETAGVTTNGYATYNSQNTRAFFGDSRAAPPPTGFVQVPGGGGYVPPVPTAWRNADPRQSALSETPEFQVQSNQFDMGGPVDTSYAPNAVSVSPVFSARPVDPLQPSDYTQLNQNPADAQTPNQADNARREATARAQGRPVDPVQSNPQANPQQPQQNTPANATQDRVTNPVAGDSAQTAAPTTDAPNDRLDATPEPEANVRRTNVPAGQGALYDRLVRIRKSQLGNRPNADAEAERLAGNDLRRRNARIKAGEDQPTPERDGGGGGGGAAPMNPPAGGDGNAPANPGATAKPADTNVDTKGDKTPMKVTTLSGEGVAAGVNDALKKAETQLREGKFASALDTYEAAERQSPNNPLVRLGKTHAELGGGFYRRAEGDLRTTLTSDPNLLGGQYDLRGFLGDERLQIIEKDLRDQVQKNEKDAGPAVLLAYVYYNTANERRAAALLDVADKRAAGKDPFITLLKQNWALPAVEGENK